MKRLLIMLASMMAAIGLSKAEETITFTVNGVSFTMVRVEGGTFTMGATEEQEIAADNNEFPTRQITLSPFCIGQTEVTQELWKAVMGKNPSHFKNDKNPVERVKWEDCYNFIKKLRSLTGKDFRFPTEAEWEFAARGGNESMGYKFSGSNKAEEVAWHEDNSRNETHKVAQKKPNELGIYDMSGNVKELCWDNYHKYEEDNLTNPVNKSGAEKVLRGGSYANESKQSRVSARGNIPKDDYYYNIGLRIALSEDEYAGTYSFDESRKYFTNPYEQKSVPPTEKFTVRGVTFTMIGVEGGTFTMGATPEQGKDAYDSEKPAHEVTLNSFQIGQTEVTQELWEAVMGDNPAYFQSDHRPVECVNLSKAFEFINRLSELTGRQFRLPTDAEWEYAARGGSKSNNYKYSGGNKASDVAWYDSRFTPYTDKCTHPVAQKKPNELGIYDMSGNVWEWCIDNYYSYDPEPLINPSVYEPAKEIFVIRGGAWNGKDKDCRVTRRSQAYRDFTVAYMGLRLAL